jgi:hypothetical protein
MSRRGLGLFRFEIEKLSFFEIRRNRELFGREKFALLGTFTCRSQNRFELSRFRVYGTNRRSDKKCMRLETAKAPKRLQLDGAFYVNTKLIRRGVNMHSFMYLSGFVYKSITISVRTGVYQ